MNEPAPAASPARRREPSERPAPSADEAPSKFYRSPRVPVLARLWVAWTLTFLGVASTSSFGAVRLRMSGPHVILALILLACGTFLYMGLAVFDPAGAPRLKTVHGAAMKAMAILNVVLGLWISQSALFTYEHDGGDALFMVLWLVAALALWLLSVALYISGDARMRAPPA